MHIARNDGTIHSISMEIPHTVTINGVEPSYPLITHAVLGIVIPSNAIKPNQINAFTAFMIITPIL